MQALRPQKGIYKCREWEESHRLSCAVKTHSTRALPAAIGGHDGAQAPLADFGGTNPDTSAWGCLPGVVIKIFGPLLSKTFA